MRAVWYDEPDPNVIQVESPNHRRGFKCEEFVGESVEYLNHI
jgi:hypothetical protein